MTDSPDERTKVDRTKDPEDPAEDAREEYTAYRDQERDRTGSSDRTGSESGKVDRAAQREAGLQPGTAGSDADDQRDDAAGGG